MIDDPVENASGVRHEQASAKLIHRLLSPGNRGLGASLETFRRRFQFHEELFRAFGFRAWGFRGCTSRPSRPSYHPSSLPGTVRTPELGAREGEGREAAPVVARRPLSPHCPLPIPRRRSLTTITTYCVLACVTMHVVSCAAISSAWPVRKAVHPPSGAGLAGLVYFHPD